jgi:hypothetical protein
MRGAETDKGGDEADAAVVAHGVGEVFEIGRAGKDAEALAEPLHAAAEHAALEGVFEGARRAAAPGR